MKHNIYFDTSAIPADAKVLGIRVRVPRILFATDEGVHDDLTISDTQMVYAELSAEEWNRVQGNQAATDALAQELGPEVATALGGYVKRWRSD